MTTTVDARGVLCPVPIIRLARTARGLPAGSLVEVLTDDPAAAHDVPAWCQLRGHALLATGPVPVGGASGDAAASPVPSRSEGSGPSDPEPHAPNPQPGQGLRHLIRLGAAPEPPSPATPGLARSAGSPAGASANPGAGPAAPTGSGPTVPPG